MKIMRGFTKGYLNLFVLFIIFLVIYFILAREVHKEREAKIYQFKMEERIKSLEALLQKKMEKKSGDLNRPNLKGALLPPEEAYRPKEGRAANVKKEKGEHTIKPDYVRKREDGVVEEYFNITTEFLDSVFEYMKKVYPYKPSNYEEDKERARMSRVQFFNYPEFFLRKPILLSTKAHGPDSTSREWELLKQYISINRRCRENNKEKVDTHFLICKGEEKTEKLYHRGQNFVVSNGEFPKENDKNRFGCGWMYTEREALSRKASSNPKKTHSLLYHITPGSTTNQV